MFASHPRTDKRLNQAIDEVTALSDVALSLVDNTDFRDAVNGLVFGESSQGQKRAQSDRYYQDILGYTVIFPENWQIKETITTTLVTEKAIGTLKIEARKIKNNIPPSEYISQELGVKQLRKSLSYNKDGIPGHTGVFKQIGTETTENIAVFYLGGRAIIIRATAFGESEEINNIFREVIYSFRAIQQGEGEKKEKHIKYVQASEYFEFRNVAGTSPIKDFPEETLRLLNGYYPAGKPKAGEWIKLVE